MREKFNVLATLYFEGRGYTTNPYAITLWAHYGVGLISFSEWRELDEWIGNNPNIPLL